MSGADPARFWQPTQHPRVLVCSAVRSKALLTDRRRSRSVELKFHGKLMGSEQGFCSQADWGPARLSGTDGAPFATGHRVCEWGGKGPLLTPLQHPPPRAWHAQELVLGNGDRGTSEGLRRDFWAPSKGTRNGWATLHTPYSHATWWVEGPRFSWQREAMCKFNLWVYDSISLQQMSREMSG